MKSKVKYLLPTILIGLIVTGVFLTVYVSDKLKEAGMKPCIWSLEAPVVDSIRNNNPEFNISLSTEWKTLSPEESDALISRLVKTRKTDCGTIKNMQEGNDYWGNSIKIAFRRTIGSTIDIKIWSIGPDGKENTEDDISIERNGLTVGG